MKLRTLLKGLIAPAALLTLLSPAAALDLSGQKVTILVPFKEGGGSDTLARFLQPFLKEALPGHPNVVVFNRPGGGSVTGVNAWVSSAETDGTDILVGSTSSWVPYVFGSETVKYDPTKMRSVAGFPRLGVFYTNPELTGVKGASSKEGVEQLKGVTIIKGANAPLSLDLGDLMALSLLDVPHKVVFGMSTSEQRRAYLAQGLSANNDSLTDFEDIAANEGEGRVSPLFAMGGIDENGKAKRIESLPDVLTLEELFEATYGDLPSGPAYRTYQIMHYLRTNLAKSIMLPPDTPQDIVDAYIEVFKSLEENPKYVEGMINEIQAQSFVYGDELDAAFAQASGFGQEERAAAEDYMQKTHGVALN